VLAGGVSPGRVSGTLAELLAVVLAEDVPPLNVR
jgi:hypothetical protein